MKILVIGAGWYGCHLALTCMREGHEVTVVDKSNTVFSGSSSKNQNRLHLGYHYPRSDHTIAECERGYAKFLLTYPHIAHEFANNLYAISATDSHTRGDKFMQKYKQPHTLHTTNPLPWHVRGIEPHMYEVDELYINYADAAAYFTNALQSVITHINPEYTNSIESILKQLDTNYDRVLNCTYNHLHPIPCSHYELFVTFLYTIPGPTFAFTLMDGPFFSIYPYIMPNTYTVTSVVHGVLWKGKHAMFEPTEELLRVHQERTEAQIREYLPDIEMNYVGYFTSWKTKPVTDTDDRSLRWEREGNVLHMYGGKITGIFDAEDIVLKTLHHTVL